MKVGVLIQTRLKSTRLPNKALEKLGNRTLIEQIVRRCKAATIPNLVAVCCPDEDVEEFFIHTGIIAYGGPEKDLYKRLLDTAKKLDLTHFVRATGDNPFVCPTLIDSICWRVKQDQYPVIVNWQRRTWPDGWDLEAYNVEWLEEYGKKTLPETEREYFAQYIVEHEPQAVHNVANAINLSLKYRLTVDWPEDLKMANIVYKEMGDQVWRGDRILQFLQANPRVAKMNVKRIDGRFGLK